jgi:virginiamycin B lyase
MIGPSLPKSKWFFKRNSAGSLSWSGNPKRPSRHAQLSVMPLEDRVLLSGVTIFKPPDSANDLLGPLGMVLGPDRALWFEDAGKLGRITTAGQITEYPAPGIDSFGPDLGVDPAGSIWYVNVLSGTLERFDVATGKITEFAYPFTAGLPTASSWTDIHWFAVGSRLFWLDSDGSLNQFPIIGSTSGFDGGGYVSGPDGNVWYSTDPHGLSVGNIVKLEPNGRTTEFAIPEGAASPNTDFVGLTVGPDGNIWFSVELQNVIGTIAPDGKITEFKLPGDEFSPNFVGPYGIITGPDGNLWVTGNGQIDRITTTGTLSQFLSLPGPGNPSGLVAGPDGNLWFCDSGSIYRMTPDTLPTATSQTIVTEVGYYSAPLATIWTVDPAEVRAIVDWGDGQITPGTFVNNGQNSYNIVAPTTFTQPGTYPVTITISDPKGGQSVIHTYVKIKPSQTASFLTGIYQDLLGRQPDSTGMAGWLSMLGQGATRTDVVIGIETSQEYRLRLIDNLYSTILGRHADGTGAAFFLQQLQSGATVEQIKSQIFGSVEYFQHSGGTSIGFLSALYKNVLGRGVDAVGARAGSMALAAGATPAAVALEVLDSQEAANVLVTGMYGQFLERKPEPVALGQWKSLLKSGTTDETLLAGIAASDEFFAKF